MRESETDRAVLLLLYIRFLSVSRALVPAGVILSGSLSLWSKQIHSILFKRARGFGLANREFASRGETEGWNEVTKRTYLAQGKYTIFFSDSQKQRGKGSILRSEKKKT